MFCNYFNLYVQNTQYEISANVLLCFQIKSMTWQKITCIKKEEVKMAANVTYDNLRKFNGFCELNFSTSKIHMDMGKLYAYLEEHKCGYIFKDYFGFEGKTSA